MNQVIDGGLSFLFSTSSELNSVFRAVWLCTSIGTCIDSPLDLIDQDGISRATSSCVDDGAVRGPNNCNPTVAGLDKPDVRPFCFDGDRCVSGAPYAKKNVNNHDFPPPQ